nr:MAG TPA: Protein of unknown function (DUF2633) [Caudoviricetes sp.]
MLSLIILLNIIRSCCIVSSIILFLRFLYSVLVD